MRITKTFGCNKLPLFPPALLPSVLLPSPSNSPARLWVSHNRASLYELSRHTPHTHTERDPHMCVACPDKINAETIHTTFTFDYTNHRERGRERKINKLFVCRPWPTIMRNARFQLGKNIKQKIKFRISSHRRGKVKRNGASKAIRSDTSQLNQLIEKATGWVASREIKIEPIVAIV